MYDFFLTTDGKIPNARLNNLLPPLASIAAGSSRTYELRGDTSCLAVNCSGSGQSGSVSVQLLGDGAPITITGWSKESYQDWFRTGIWWSAPFEASRWIALSKYSNENPHEASLIWTDFWRTPTQEFASTTASNTEQWFNGFLVPTANGGTLPATSSPAVISR